MIITKQELDRTAKIEKPTEQLMSEGMQFAYDFFNQKLFRGELPQCMITIDCRYSSAIGYFSPFSYVSDDSTLVHQINMNADFLRERTLKQSLSTLVHEQIHQLTFEVSERKKCNGYHCKKWAKEMEAVGLIPSHTGKSGGRKTGCRMTHYIQDGGLFDKACDELIASGFGIKWVKASSEMQAKALGLTSNHTSKATDNNKGKVKFKCPTCANTCWAAPSRNLVCGDHMTRMQKE